MFKVSNGFLWITEVMILCFLCSVTDAHDLHISEITVVPDKSQMHVELKFNAFELRFISELDQNANGQIEKGEFYEKRDAIIQRLLESLKIEIDGLEIEARASGLMLDASSHHLVFRAHYPVSGPVESLKLTSDLQSITSQSHVTLVTYRGATDKQLAKLEARSNSVVFHPAVTRISNGNWWESYFYTKGMVLLMCFGLIAGGLFYGFKRPVFQKLKS